MRCLLLLRRRLTALAFLRLVTFRTTGMIILELLIATYCIYLAVSGPGKQPSSAASGSKQAHNLGGDRSVSTGFDPRGSGVCCLLLPVLLLLLLRQRLPLPSYVWSHFVLVMIKLKF